MSRDRFGELERRQLLVPPFTMPELLCDAAARSPAAPWIEGDAGEWTFEDALAKVRNIATTLIERGVRRGDRIAMCMPNTPGAVLGLHAIWHVGAVPALLHPAYAQDMQVNQIGLVEPSLIIGEGERAARLADLTGVPLLGVGDAGPVPGSPALPDRCGAACDDLALLQFTGGTTGAPKAARLTHSNLSFGLAQIALALPGLRPGEERTLPLAPFSHITGLNGVLGLITYLRGTLVLPPPAPSDLAEACARSRATYLAGPPTMLTALVEAQKNARLHYSLRHVISGGAPLPGEVKQRFEAATGAKVVDGYGLSETAPAVALGGQSVAATQIALRGPGSEALVSPGEIGEICVRGPQVMEGYWQNETETALVLREGELRTGDLAYQDGEGKLVIVDRLKEVIIASGYNIYPSRVEDAISAHPAVREVAVVGLGHAYRGETVAAAVALREGESLTLDELQGFLQARLSPMEMPRELVIWDDLPKSPAGKILRRTVRQGMEPAEQESARHNGTKEG